MIQTDLELEIRREAAACREACKHCKVGDVMQHIHHEQWLEILTEPIENRIAFILANKTPPEQAERLRRLRPFNWKKAYADLKKAYDDLKKACADWKKACADEEKAYADWEKVVRSPQMLALHAQVCGCPWDKTHDIFGKKMLRPKGTINL